MDPEDLTRLLPRDVLAALDRVMALDPPGLQCVLCMLCGRAPEDVTAVLDELFPVAVTS